MKLSSFFSDVVVGDRNDLFDAPPSGNKKQDEHTGYGSSNSICRLMAEAHANYPHLGRIRLEKMRLHHRLEVVQNLEDNQRKNVLRSIQTDLGDGAISIGSDNKLSYEELKAVYAYVKNAQLLRASSSQTLYHDTSTPDPSTPFYELYKIDFASFSDLHKLLSLWGVDGGQGNDLSMGVVLAERTFRLMDTNFDGLLNFKELVQVLEILCKADHVKKLKLLYCLHLPGLVLPGELDEDVQFHRKDKRSKSAESESQVGVNKAKEFDGDSTDGNTKVEREDCSDSNVIDTAESADELARDAEEFFTVATKSLKEMADGLKLTKENEDVGSTRTEKKLTGALKEKSTNDTDENGISSLRETETSSLRSLVGRIFETQQSQDYILSERSDEVQKMDRCIDRESCKPYRNKKLPPLPRKHFLHLWRTLHDLFEYNQFAGLSAGDNGEPGVKGDGSSENSLIINMSSNDTLGYGSSDINRASQDQLYQSITMVGTLLLQIGEVGQRVKDLQLKQQQNDTANKVVRSKSTEDKVEDDSATDALENKAVPCDGQIYAVPTSYSCYDILSSQTNNEERSQMSSQELNDNTNKEGALGGHGDCLQEHEGISSSTNPQLSQETSSVVDLDDWSITFEQFLASILNESCLVSFFDQNVDILKKLKVKNNNTVYK